MPTGYTAAIQDGEVTTLEQFALRCARNFGALVMMRDEPMDAPIPEKFEPTDYHQKKINEAFDQLQHLSEITFEEISDICAQEYEAEVKRIAESNARDEVTRQRYTEMLRQVRHWEPLPAPTPSHPQQGNTTTGKVERVWQ